MNLRRPQLVPKWNKFKMRAGVKSCLRRALTPLRQGRRRQVKPATSGPMVEWLLDAVGGGCGAEDGYAHAVGRWSGRPWRM